MQSYFITKVGQNKGRPRVWLQGKRPALAGFNPGVKYELVIEADSVALRISAEGSRVVSQKVVGEKAIPIIDVNSSEALAMFDGLTELRVVMRENEILLLPTASERRIRERTDRVLRKLRNGEPLSVGALAYGGGVLDHALHYGMADGGVKCELAFANEIREDLAEHAAEHNPTFTDKTIALVAPMQELAFDDAAMHRLPKVDVLVAGIPCSGASLSGRAKRKLEVPEDHPLVGHLVAAAVAIIAKVSPFAVIIENVPAYANTASAAILRNQLRDLGYDTHERELRGTDFGDLENRNRWCFVAVTRGCEFALDSMTAPARPERTLADVLEPAEAVEDRWSEMVGLKAKQERDIAAGKGFKMQVYDGSETVINTLTKGIAKNRSTDPKFQHPTNPDLLRIPKAVEHARIKGVPEELITGLSETTAHELLGQGICYSPFKALGCHLAQALRKFEANYVSAAQLLLTRIAKQSTGALVAG